MSTTSTIKTGTYYVFNDKAPKRMRGMILKSSKNNAYNLYESLTDNHTDLKKIKTFHTFTDMFTYFNYTGHPQGIANMINELPDVAAHTSKPITKPNNPHMTREDMIKSDVESHIATLKTYRIINNSVSARGAVKLLLDCDDNGVIAQGKFRSMKFTDGQNMFDMLFNTDAYFSRALAGLIYIATEEGHNSLNLHIHSEGEVIKNIIERHTNGKYSGSRMLSELQNILDGYSGLMKEFEYATGKKNKWYYTR